jgi:hypothetical protein
MDLQAARSWCAGSSVSNTQSNHFIVKQWHCFKPSAAALKISVLKGFAKDWKLL